MPKAPQRVLPDRSPRIAYVLPKVSTSLISQRALNLAIGIANDIYTPEKRQSAFGDIARAQAEIGQITVALITADKMKKGHYQRDSALAVIAEAQAKAGQIAKALETSEAIKRSSYRVTALTEIAKAHAKLGNRLAARSVITKALAIVQRMQGKGDWAWPGALKLIATAQAMIGDIADALQTAGGIASIRVYLHAMTLSSIAEQQAKFQGKPAARVTLATALKLGKGYQSPRHRSLILAVVATAQVRIGDRAAALRTWEQALSASIKVKENLWLRVMRDSRIAVRQAEAGEKEAAQRTIALALETTKTIKSQGDLALALSYIAKAQNKVGDSTVARKTLVKALEIAKRTKRILAFAWTARSLAEIGDAGQAIETAKLTPSPRYRVQALTDIVKVLARAKN